MLLKFKTFSYNQLRLFIKKTGFIINISKLLNILNNVITKKGIKINYI